MLPDKDRITVGIGPRDVADALVFMRQAVKAQTVYIQFTAMQGDVTSQFDGLKTELDKHQECSVK
jgi:hypothetical protein